MGRDWENIIGTANERKPALDLSGLFACRNNATTVYLAPEYPTRYVMYSAGMSQHRVTEGIEFAKAWLAAQSAPKRKVKNVEESSNE
jgi:hypothetical protein